VEKPNFTHRFYVTEVLGVPLFIMIFFTIVFFGTIVLIREIKK